MPDRTLPVVVRNLADWPFAIDEFRCRCGCGKTKVRPAFLDALTDIRSRYGYPLIVTSGYRCENHPAERAKDAPGAHYDCWAADVYLKGMGSPQGAYGLLRAIWAHNADPQALQVTGLGFASSYLHVDCCPAGWRGVRPNIWVYAQ